VPSRERAGPARFRGRNKKRREGLKPSLSSATYYLCMLDFSSPDLLLTRHEELFRNVFEEGPLGMTVVDPQGAILAANDRVCAMLGYKKEELLGRSFADFTLAADIQREQELTIQLFSGEIPNFKLEKQIRQKDGGLRWIELHASVIRNQAGQPAFGLGTIEDVTERKMAQDALARRETLWRSVFESSVIGIGVADLSGRLRASNAAYQQMMGYSAAELHSMSYLDITCEEDREMNRRLVAELVNGSRQFFEIEKRYKRKDGSHIWTNIRCCIVPATATEPQFTIGIIEDITNRRLAEDELKKKNEILETIFDHIPVMIHLIDRNGYIRLINRESEQKLGWSLKEIRDQFVDIIDACHPEPEDRQAVRDHVARADREWADFRPTSRQGEIIDSSWANVRLSDGTALAIGIDIRARKQAEAALRESEHRFRQLAEKIRDVFWLLDPAERRVLYVSPAYEQIWGRPAEDVYRDRAAFLDCIHPEDKRAVSAAIDKQIGDNLPFQAEYRIVRPDGTIRWIWDRSFPVKGENGEVYRVVGVAEDITERKQIEHERQHSLEQLRALAASLQTVREEERTKVAREIHDELGQSLTAVKLEVFALLKRVDPDGAYVKEADSILKLIDDSVHAVRRISTELRPGVLDDLGLQAAIEWAAEEFETRTGINCKLSLPESDVCIDRDRTTAIFRILQETLTNVARHAQASRVEIRMLMENESILMEVSDNGTGFDARKPHQVGDALGILGMRERALLAGGELQIHSTPRVGTLVRVRMPAITQNRAELIS
jgi:PAS domain S-box-containing protein